jgi:tetratricopeptide (TPR) repeat protein
MAEAERANVARALSDADSLRSAGDHDNAIERYETVLLWDPENAGAKTGLAGARYERSYSLAAKAEAGDNFVEAIFYANQALSFSPADPAAASLLARCSEKVKAAENSQALLNKLLKTSIDLYAERRFAEALSGFEQVLGVAPTSALAREYADKCRRNIAEVVSRHRADAERRARSGDYQGAVSALEAAREYAPDDPAIAEAIARYNGRIEAASAGGLAADDESPALKASAGTTSRDATPVDKALDEQYRKGMALFNAGNFDGAIASLVKVWTVQPDYYSVSDLLAKAYIFVGMRYYSENKHVEAIENWHKALSVDPTNSKAKRYLAKAEEELQKLRGVSRAR